VLKEIAIIDVRRKLEARQCYLGAQAVEGRTEGTVASEAGANALVCVCDSVCVRVCVFALAEQRAASSKSTLEEAGGGQDLTDSLIMQHKQRIRAGVQASVI
jgi:hypothetical protein